MLPGTRLSALPISGLPLAIFVLSFLRLLMHFLHVPELLSHLAGCPGDRHDEIEDKTVQYIEYDGKKEYFW